MKNKNFNKALIIGPSGIGTVHLRELLRFGFEEIAFLGKSNSKKRTFIVNLKNNKQIKIINLKKLNNIKNFKPDVTNICSPFKNHYEHILACKNYSKFLIVEKPFIWFSSNLKKRKEYKTSVKLLENSKKKILVNLPMISLAQQLIKKKELPVKLNLIKFFYFTRGKQIKQNIAVDLLPHAISFLFTLIKKKNFDIKVLNILEKNSEWSCRLKIDKTLCVFHFKQNMLYKESILKLNINNNKYIRFQKQLGNERVNYLVKNKKKKIQLKNPMTDYLNNMLKNLKNRRFVSKNNELVIKVAKLKELLLS